MSEQKISDYQKKRCMNIINKLCNYHISFMFLNPVDPERDQCPKYFQYVKRPMDLSTVRKNLEENKYSTVSQFKEDVNLIWENAYRYNGKKSIVSLLARQLQTTFKEMSEFLTNNEIYDWAIELENLKNEVNTIAKNGSTSSTVQFSSNIYSGISSQPSTRSSSRQSDSTSEILQQTELAKKTSAKKSHTSHSQQPQQEKQSPTNLRQVSKKAPKHSLLDIDQSKSSIRSSHSLYNLPLSRNSSEADVPHEINKKAPPLNEEEIQKIVDDVQLIEDVTIMNKIIDIIRKGTSSSNIHENDFDEIEIKVADIKNSALVEVKKYLETLHAEENEKVDGDENEDLQVDRE